MKDDTGEIFTLDEVAAYLKVGKRTVYRLAAAKKIPAFKGGGTWRFQREEIDQWIKRQTAEAQSGDDPGGSRGETNLSGTDLDSRQAGPEGAASKDGGRNG